MVVVERQGPDEGGRWVATGTACVYGHPKLGWPYTRTRRCQKYGHPKYEKPFEFKFKNFGWGYRSLAADTGVVIQRAEQAGGDGGA